MIAAHLEPKGLHRDAPAHDDRKSFKRQRAAAVTGSRRLRNAILITMGIAPPSDRKWAPAVVKPVRAQLCEKCQSPLSPRRILVADIQQTVSTYYGFPADRMMSNARLRDISHARHVAMYLASTLTHLSIAEVGRRFNRDHTTVLYAIRQVPKRAEADLELAFDIALLRGRLAA